MEKPTLLAMTKLLSILSAAGFMPSKGSKHFMKAMNVDTSHSILRVPLILASLYGGSSKTDIKTARTVLTGIGAFYVAMAVAGSFDRKVGGALPSRLTTFDIVYHLVVGGGALWLGNRAGRMMKSD